ncbi:superoxide dismutase [Sphingomonas xanthus]|uniref:Superoxide dismutase n=1 Tax=Sphingomonas xanthus TaxID=2594473 RepID=A0A516IPB1_9SPHN|nr:superoxide dismutase [Sphingomonas xanthus]QDP18765.1 superoxide dismutase [Sphingomonas xanthus]
MAFTLPDLPFAKDALGPHMSAETLDYHHGKHHKAYVDKTNGMLAEKGLEGASLVEVIKTAKEKGDKGLFNNSAQIWNHSFFWQCLAPEGSTRPSGKLRDMIASDFGEEQNLLEKLATESVNHFASGWGWLVLNNGKLEITSLHDADTPVVHGMTPLLTIDVWEHAYYIDYRNERPRFVKTVLENIVNWDFVAQNLDGKGIERADQGARAKAHA